MRTLSPAVVTAGKPSHLSFFQKTLSQIEKKFNISLQHHEEETPLHPPSRTRPLHHPFLDRGCPPHSKVGDSTRFIAIWGRTCEWIEFGRCEDLEGLRNWGLGFGFGRAGFKCSSKWDKREWNGREEIVVWSESKPHRCPPSPRDRQLPPGLHPPPRRYGELGLGCCQEEGRQCGRGRGRE